MVMFAGVTAMDTRLAFVTVRVAGGLVIDPTVAVIWAVPGATVVASPCGGTLLMVATLVGEDVQVAVVVRLPVVPSAYVPVAVNCCLNPAAIDTVAGVTAMETSGFVTVNTAAGDAIVPTLAVIFAVPAATPDARPVVLMVAMVPSDDCHVAVALRSFVVPSE